MKQNIYVGFFLILAAACAVAQTPDIDTIIQKYDDNSVFDTITSESTLTVKNTLGTTKNSFSSYSKRNGDTLITITEGADRGQKILRQNSSIYLYYPDAEEVIRLSGSALKDSIMGSDYSYEDLTGDNSIAANYNAKLIAEEPFNGADCFHVMLTAKGKKQKYKMQEIWIDKQTYCYHKVILYSASGKAIRSMEVQSFLNVNGFTIPENVITRDLLKKNSETTMQVKSAKINTPIDDKYFSRDELTW